MDGSTRRPICLVARWMRACLARLRAKSGSMHAQSHLCLRPSTRPPNLSMRAAAGTSTALAISLLTLRMVSSCEKFIWSVALSVCACMIRTLSGPSSRGAAAAVRMRDGASEMWAPTYGSEPKSCLGGVDGNSSLCVNLPVRARVAFSGVHGALVAGRFFGLVTSTAPSSLPAASSEEPLISESLTATKSSPMSISPSSGYKRSDKRVGALAFGRQSRARRKLEWTRGCDDLLVPIAEPRNMRAVSALARECVCARWRSTRGARARTLTTSSAMVFAGAVTAKAASCISACASRAAAKVPGMRAPASRRPGAECGSDVGGNAPDERGQWNARARNAHSGTCAPARPCMHASTRLRCGRARACAPAAECNSRICNRTFIPMPTQAAEPAPASSRCDRFSRSADVTHAYPRQPLSLRP